VRDRAFFFSFSVSLAWATLQSLAVSAAGYSLAVLMYESPRARGWVYASLLVPWGIPAIMAVPLWRMIIHGAGGDSILSAFLGLRTNLLTDVPASFLASIFVSSWMRLPAAVFVIYGALRKLPSTTIDAARLDGADRIRLSGKMYWPLVRSSVVSAFALEFAAGFKEFGVPFLLTAGGPPLVGGITERTVLGATTTLEIYLYDLFRGAEDYGLASAYAAVVGLAVAILAALAFLVGRGGRDEADARRGAPRPPRAGPPRRGLEVLSRLEAVPRMIGRAASDLLLAFRGTLALIMGLSSLLLVYSLLRAAFSGLSSAYIDSFLPPFPTSAAFGEIFTEDGIGRTFANTLLVSAITAILCPLLVLPAALRLRSAKPGTKALVFGLVQALGAAAGMHSLLPLYGIFLSLGLVGGYIPIVIIYLFHAAPFSLFVATAFLEGLPRSLEESAGLEGAGKARVFASILLPLSLPAAAVAAMSAFLAAWNGFLVPLLFIDDDSKYTIALRLYGYVGSLASGAPLWNRFAAACLVNLALISIVLWRFKNPLGRAPLSEHDE